MAKDVLYTNGVIAVREKYLLKDKIFKLCETDAEEALRTLVDGGFGKGAEVNGVYEYERLVSADEESIDAFIREYAPSAAEAEYLLAPRDFHNAKAAVKAHYLNLDAEKMFAPDGLIPSAEILNGVKERDYSKFGNALRQAVTEAAALFEAENAEASGAEIGIIFEKAQYLHLSRVCAKNRVLKKLLQAKADMTNILTALRCADAEYASECFVAGGKLTKNQLSKIFSADGDKAEHALDGTDYAAFYSKCLSDKAQGLPLTAAERVLDSYEAEFFSKNKYELQRNQPFLYYVFRRRAENANVRILFVCLLAGMNESDVKKRLRTF